MDRKNQPKCCENCIYYVYHFSRQGGLFVKHYGGHCTKFVKDILVDGSSSCEMYVENELPKEGVLLEKLAKEIEALKIALKDKI